MPTNSQNRTSRDFWISKKLPNGAGLQNIKPCLYQLTAGCSRRILRAERIAETTETVVHDTNRQGHV